MSATDLRVVALGGGHGLAATLTALREVTTRITAVVTVGDDGGSSGRIRRELGLIPPGDLRMALCSLAANDADTAMWVDLLQHRFGGGGALAGHAIGNLLLAGLTERGGDPIAALDVVGRLVGVQGRVLPMSPAPVDIAAEVEGLDPAQPRETSTVYGQVAVATTPGKVLSVRLVPERPTATAEAVAAVYEADWIVLGPGSWFTSVIPNLLVPALADALVSSSARRLVVLNLAPQPGETEGFSPLQHLDALRAHAPALDIDVVLADPRAAAPLGVLRRELDGRGTQLVVTPLTEGDDVLHHEPKLLTAALAAVLAPPLSG